MKVRKSSWNYKKMEVNFNYKEWRQDFASYLREKNYWESPYVGRARKAKFGSEREFYVKDRAGREFYIRYCDKNKIIFATNVSLVEEYLKSRRFN